MEGKCGDVLHCLLLGADVNTACGEAAHQTLLHRMCEMGSARELVAVLLVLVSAALVLACASTKPVTCTPAAEQCGYQRAHHGRPPPQRTPHCDLVSRQREKHGSGRPERI